VGGHELALNRGEEEGAYFISGLSFDGVKTLIEIKNNGEEKKKRK